MILEDGEILSAQVSDRRAPLVGDHDVDQDRTWFSVGGWSCGGGSDARAVDGALLGAGGEDRGRGDLSAIQRLFENPVQSG